VKSVVYPRPLAHDVKIKIFDFIVFRDHMKGVKIYSIVRLSTDPKLLWEG
jgi:hypothetical protein